MKERNSILQFVDTNIFIYAFDRSDPDKNMRSTALVKKLWHTGNGCLSSQVLQELYVNITQKVPKPLPYDKASLIIADLGQWKFHMPDLKDILEAITIQQRFELSFWDALIICSANCLGCSILWSEDLSHKQKYGEVTVINPFLE